MTRGEIILSVELVKIWAGPARTGLISGQPLPCFWAGQSEGWPVLWQARQCPFDKPMPGRTYSSIRNH